MYQKNISIVIGRFQIFHNGHFNLIKESFKTSDQTLLLIGSAYQASDIKNPFFYHERLEYITNIFKYEVDTKKLIIEPIRDYMYSDLDWINQVQQVVNDNTSPDDTLTLIGHHKDSSSYYLDEFPQWKFHEYPNYRNVNSSELRDYFYTLKLTTLKDIIPPEMFSWLINYSDDEHNRLYEEHKHVIEYKSQWNKAPYAVPFTTVDAVVYCKGHILMVKRKAQPGLGMWALPGGFFDIEKDNSIEEAIIRELKEETGLKDFHKYALLNILSTPKVFAAKNRSIRGRTITHAGFINLYYPQPGLPKVKGADDAEKAKWIPLAELNSVNFMEHTFEDHNHIIHTLTSELMKIK